MKIKEIYNRYVGPNVLYISQMLLYIIIVFEIIDGLLTEMLMPTYIVNLEVLVYYVRGGYRLSVG